jgi:hypothetical protein
MAVMVVAAGGTRDWGRRLSFPLSSSSTVSTALAAGRYAAGDVVGSENDPHGPLWWVCGLG